LSSGKKYVSVGLEYKKLIPAQYIEIRYEDLLSHPVTHLQAILDFIEVPSSVAKQAVDKVGVRQLAQRQWINLPKVVDSALESELFRSLGYADQVLKLKKEFSPMSADVESEVCHK